MTDQASSRAANLLLRAAYASAFIGLALAFTERNAVSGLRWVTLFTVGIMGVIVFARRVVMARGGGEGAEAGMQIGLAHLAWGLVALLMVLRQSSPSGLIAVSLVFASYLVLSAAWRLIVLVRSGEGKAAAFDFVGVGTVAFLAAAIAWFAAAALRVGHP
jgi:hypothetical protein